MALPVTKTQRVFKLLRSICSCKVFQKCACPWTKRRNATQSVPLSTQQGTFLLPQDRPSDKHCLVIDLDETLVHSTFEPIDNPDFVISIQLNNITQNVYILKRPYVDEFLQRMGALYECVLFTASLAMYADQLTSLLDKWNVFSSRLYRESCTFQQNCYIKDLSKLGRSLERVVILDNSPVSYLFHPENAVPVSSWFEDKTDTQLLYMIPFLERLAKTDNVYSILRNSNHPLNDTSQMKNLTKDFFSPV